MPVDQEIFLLAPAKETTLRWIDVSE